MTHGWSEARQAFNQYADSDVLDASVLILPLVLMIAPSDPRMLSTLDAIRDALVSDSFVFRYDPEDAADDGLPGREGSFSLCSFWYVECLTRAGSWTRPGSCSRRCSATPTISGSTRRRSARVARRSATSRRRSRTSA